jgi:hypothetical protein
MRGPRILNSVRLGAGAGTALALGVVLSLFAGAGANAASPTPVDLGNATSFAVLAGTEVTNTLTTTVSGDIGVSPGSSAPGFPPGIITNGNLHVTDVPAASAQAALGTAYDNAALATPATNPVPFTDLSGMTLVPGVYSGGALGNTGTLSLDAGGDPNAVWIFQASSSLITDSGSTISFVNGVGSACNVFWQVTSSATLGSNSTFIGTIMALTSITATTGAAVEGRLLARNGGVSLQGNSITVPAACAGTIAPGGTKTSSTVAAPGATPVTPPAASRADELAATGANPTGGLLFGGFLVIGGAAMLLLRRYLTHAKSASGPEL